MNARQTTDVVIVGGGVIGCAIAYYLSQAGAKVTVVERDKIAAEASSAAAGLLAPLGELSEPGAVTDLFLASWSLYPELIPVLEAASGVQVAYHRPGSLHIVTNPQEASSLRQQLSAWMSLGAQVTWLTGDEARAQEPLLASNVEAAIYAPQEGSMLPPAMTRAYAGAAIHLGAHFAEQTEITGIQHTASRVTGVQTALGETIPCQHLVIATGAWSAYWSQLLGFPLPVHPLRGQILSLRQPASPLQHILFGQDIYLVPKLDGTIYVGATVEQAGFEKCITVGGISWLLSSAVKLAPALESASIVNLWAGLRPGSPDSRPILGKAPGWENVTLATGHTATGFELSAITGQTIAELVTSGRTPEIIRAFGVERFLAGNS
ncbi:MAG: glycine oxidase ThiO [Ktedonobacteraceae bacterium]|jgi:glycine oxidase